MNTLQGMPVWWQSRAPRERVMVAVMVAAIAAFIGWYALLVPLRHWRSGAQARYDHAAEALLMARASHGGTVAAIPLARITQSARDATITITRQQRSPTGTLAVQIDTVTSPVLFAWLEQLRQRHGLTPSALEITRRDGQLQVRCTFSGIAP